MLYLVSPSLSPSLIALCILGCSIALISGTSYDAVGDMTAAAAAAAEENWPSLQNMNWLILKGNGLQNYAKRTGHENGQSQLQLHDQPYPALGINEIDDDSNEFFNNQGQISLETAADSANDYNNINNSDDNESNNQIDINQLNLQELLNYEMETLLNIADNSSCQLMNQMKATPKTETSVLKQRPSETILLIDGKDINKILIKEPAEVMKSGINLISVETTLDRIEDFLDSLGKVITNTDEDSDQMTPRIDEVWFNDEAESDEVQGFNYNLLKFNESSSVATGETTTTSGRARKSKKNNKDDKKMKMMNWLWPLLIAYKLKFFMLIPIMIAGLTLLVGSTGMAGFFFALFTVVAASRSW